MAGFGTAEQVLGSPKDRAAFEVACLKQGWGVGREREKALPSTSTFSPAHASVSEVSGEMSFTDS